MAVVKEPSWKSYLVKSVDPIFSIDECNRIMEVGRSLPSQDAEVGTGTNEKTKSKKDYKIRRTDIAWIPFKHPDSQWIYSRLEHWMHTVNNKHMGFNQLQIGEPAQFTMYSKKHHYDWHSDSSYEMSKEPTVRKMTMVTLLNDPKEFKGGELQIIDSKKSLPLKQGYAIFFASFIAHRVLPVKKGTRISMPIWFGGPPLT